MPPLQETCLSVYMAYKQDVLVYLLNRQIVIRPNEITDKIKQLYSTNLQCYAKNNISSTIVPVYLMSDNW